MGYIPFRRLSSRLLLFAVLAIVGVITWMLHATERRASVIGWAAHPHLPSGWKDPSQPSSSSGPSSYLFPVHDDGKTHSWVNVNHVTMQALLRCMEAGDCAPNQEKVVILGSYHFRGGEFLGWTGGEDIWGKSTITALSNLGYSYLFSNSIDHMVQLYQMFPSLVRVVIMEGTDIEECFVDKEECVMSPHNPYGVPVWKLLSLSFWPGSGHPLGYPWTLMPEPYELEGHTPGLYLGYSIEAPCRARSFVPHASRPGQMYIIAKRLGYFHPSAEPAWPQSFYPKAVLVTGQEFVMGAKNDTTTFVKPQTGVEVGPFPPEELIPPGVRNLGKLKQDPFLTQVGLSSVLVGIGNPRASPTPYDALCLGVPFINPILRWDSDHPDKREGWDSMHPQLKFFDPPYVYNVFAGDEDGFMHAIKKAIANPIDSYVLERMKMTSIEERLEAILETDFQKQAQELLQYRIENRERPLFTVTVT